MDFGIGIIYQELNLAAHLNIAENIFLGREPHGLGGGIDGKKMRRDAQALMADLGMTLDVRTLVGSLSGGNQQKVVLAKWLETPLKLLILDEPTCGIDVGAKREIYGIMNDLAAQGVAILMISSELPEVLGMADQIIVVRGGRIAGHLPRAEATQEKVGRLALTG